MVNLNSDRDREDPGFYGSSAEEYERILVPRRLEAPARDLLAMVNSAPASPILDVGTGTGVIPDLCVKEKRWSGLCVGIDPIMGMLKVARSKGHANLVVASTPGLPFPSRCFGTVVASFVLSHVDLIDESLKDMLRVLRPGGTLAVSSWGRDENAYRAIWIEAVGEFIDQESLDREVRLAIPNEDTLEDPGALRGALGRSGLVEVRSQVKIYQKSETALEFFQTRSTLVSSRIMASRLGPPRWRQFRDRVIERLLSNFSEPLEYIATVNFASGRKS
jgi:SAM-dependent methyltransferase